MWSVGTKLWNRDFASIYSALNDFEWPGHLNNVMNCIKGYLKMDLENFIFIINDLLTDSTRSRALNLIAKGYTSISLDEVITYIGLPLEETVKMIENLGWQVDQTTRFVKPIKPTVNLDEGASSEENLGKLTEYVAFLEN